MRGILNHRHLLQTLSNGHNLLVASTVTALFLGMMAAFGSVSQQVETVESLTTVVEKLVLDENVIATLPAPDDRILREIRIERGNTLASIFTALNMRDEEASRFFRSSDKVELMARQLAPGKTVTAQLDAQGRLWALMFPLDGEKREMLWVERGPEGSTARQQAFSIEPKIAFQSAVIRHSLFGAADAAGIPDSVAVQLADIFGSDIDFHRDLRKDDRFSVVYETATHLGRPIRTHRILAAEFVNDGKTFRAFWYQDKTGKGGYYTEAGLSMRKAFLRSPLEFSRVTSGFSSARYHPVLKETRAHRGIDYGAPIGTRIKATGTGTIEFIGTQGGYGKMVQIRHAGDKTTLYGHMSGFAAGLKKGSRVNQGDVIGYVGATGLASGPHLHYEFRIGGVYRNPLTVVLPNAEPLQPSQMAAFRLHADELNDQLAMAGDIKLVQLD